MVFIPPQSSSARCSAGMEREDVHELAYRFEGDPFCRAEHVLAFFHERLDVAAD